MTFSRFSEEKKVDAAEKTVVAAEETVKAVKAEEKNEPTTHKVERKPEAKKPEPKKEEEKAAPARKSRTTVLRDIVEDLEGGEHISDEMRYDLQELNRRLTRALAS